MQERIIDRILQVHGISKGSDLGSSYPEWLNMLIEIQKLIDPSHINYVIVKVLKHLNYIRVLDSKEHKPKYLDAFIDETLIKR